MLPVSFVFTVGAIIGCYLIVSNVPLFYRTCITILVSLVVAYDYSAAFIKRCVMSLRDQVYIVSIVILAC